LINNNVFTDFVFQYLGLIQKCMRMPTYNQVNILGLLCQKHIAYLRSIIIVIAQMRKTNNQITMGFLFENPHHLLCNFYWLVIVSFAILPLIHQAVPLVTQTEYTNLY